MKNPTVSKSTIAIACAVLLQAGIAFAQDSVTTSTVTTDGVVQQMDPTESAIMVTSSTSTAPIKYTYSKTTTFVDGAGNVVTYDSIKQNTPARIYYTKVGDSYVVTKFVANPTVTVVAPVTAATPIVEESTSTTTTTTGK